MANIQIKLNAEFRSDKDYFHASKELEFKTGEKFFNRSKTSLLSHGIKNSNKNITIAEIINRCTLAGKSQDCDPKNINKKKKKYVSCDSFKSLHH